MSLVAYEYSSDDGSDQEEPEETKQPVASAPVKQNGTPNVPSSSTQSATLEDQEPDVDELPKHSLHLPAPKLLNDLSIEEEDDEFLHKKAIPANIPVPKPPPAKPKVRNGKVQITIPSMKDFDDVETRDAKKEKPIIGAAMPKKTTSLLSMLPKPRTALFDPKPSPAASGSAPASATFSKRLVPDSVANRPRNVPLSAQTQSNSRPTGAKPAKPGAGSSAQPPDNSDEEEEDEQMVDFFSFNKVDELPTVSTNEISAMVAKKAAKIAENVRKYTEPEEPSDGGDTSGAASSAYDTAQPHQPAEEDLASETALAALIGGNRAKRARLEEVDLIEITSADIVPSKEDFLRRQLQDETGYVPTGHLVGDWTCTSKRKSHITQLASKAQANAQELEAMWAANRQSRRQTQSKYGF
ncbi:AGAP006356-PA [Anopheles gambiae str. PEST]|uniref:AGAP006356-PA n=2 Tax=gambiae species complex TaxID=44542 RepID=A7UU79_ANOGA|nr:proline-rich protein PRCC [Anopheles gambiae]EDO63857.1 AGAP006356-PA [Anopheles gambiae str. PEST]